jgi:hypothetical protein
VIGLLDLRGPNFLSSRRSLKIEIELSLAADSTVRLELRGSRTESI